MWLNPKSKRQAPRSRVNWDDYEQLDHFPSGQHRGEVLMAKEKTSDKTGESYLMLMLGLVMPDGKKVKYFHNAYPDWELAWDNMLQALLPTDLYNHDGQNAVKLKPGDFRGAGFVADFEPSNKRDGMHLKSFLTKHRMVQGGQGGQQQQGQLGGPNMPPGHAMNYRQGPPQGGGQPQTAQQGYGSNSYGNQQGSYQQGQGGQGQTYGNQPEPQQQQSGGWGNQGGQQQQSGGWGNQGQGQQGQGWGN
jgi:hypothetical protein